MVASVDTEGMWVAFELESGARYTFTYKGYFACVIAVLSLALIGWGGYVAVSQFSFSNPKGTIACKSNNEAEAERRN